MASAKKPNNFSAEDFSRFLIREFLKKSGFDRTYDIFMTEDQRPKVTMTKSELTSLLGMEQLVRSNNKTKTYNTMLDVISSYLAAMKQSMGGVSMPVGGSTTTTVVSAAPPKAHSVNRSSPATTDTTQASTTSSYKAPLSSQPQRSNQ